MNKKYIKYLPVEGNINPKDKFIHNLYDGIIHTNEDDSTLVISKESMIKKVKPFLLTKDIKVGDIVDTYAHQLQGKIIEIEMGKVWLDPNINGASGFCYSEWYDYNILKVIGEISPDAKWVKEGMTFNDDQLEFFLRCRKHPDESIYLDYEQLEQWIKLNPNPVSYVPTIKIKCSQCNYFH